MQHTRTLREDGFGRSLSQHHLRCVSALFSLTHVLATHKSPLHTKSPLTVEHNTTMVYDCFGIEIH